MDDRVDVGALMHDIGRAAKAASFDLAFAPSAQKDAALRAAADTIWADRATLLDANAADMADAAGRGLSPAMLDRLKLDEGRVRAMTDGLRAIADQADPVGQVIAEVGPSVGAAHSPGAHAARRDRRDLRKPAERDGRRRGALPEGGQRGDPAGRIREPALGAGDPCRPRRRAEGGRAARGGDPAGPDDRPGRGRGDADHDRVHRRDRAARRQGAGRPGAGRGAGAGVRASRRHRPCLRRPGRRPREGAGGDPERQDPAHRRLRRGRVPADRPRLLRGRGGAVRRRPDRGRCRGARRRRAC